MRWIIFRGRIDGKDEWAYGNLIQRGYEAFIDDGEEHYVEPDTVGQFTGIKDINGKDIYEGDVVLSRNGEKSTVAWSDEAACFCLKGDTLPEEFSSFVVKLVDLEVIGSIWN